MEHLKQKAVAFLRKTESYTKTDMVYLAKGGSFLGLGQVVSSGVAFLLSIAFANLLPKEAFGIYKYVLSVVGVATSFSLTGLDTAIAQSVAKGLEGALRGGWKVLFRSALISSTILGGAALYYFLQNNILLGWSLIIAALATPFLKSFLLYNSFLIGKKDFAKKVQYGIFYDVIPAGILCALLVTGGNILLLIGGYFFAYTCTAAILYKKTIAVYKLQDAIDEETKRFSFHLSMMNIVGSVSFQLDKILAFHYLGGVQLAVYSFALALPQQIRQIQKHIATLLLPKFTARSFSDVRQGIAQKALLFFIFMAVLCGIYILIAPLMYQLFFPQYLDSIIYSQVFSLILLTSPSMFFKQAMIAHRKTKRLYLVTTILPIIKILALLIFVPHFEIWGAIYTLLITEVLGLIVSIFLFYLPEKSEHLEKTT